MAIAINHALACARRDGLTGARVSLSWQANASSIPRCTMELSRPGSNMATSLRRDGETWRRQR
jgi:hypothetical protein